MPTLFEPVALLNRFTPSQDSLQLALGAAQAGIWEWHLDSNLNLWSDEVWPLYGLDPAQTPASFDSWIDSVHPIDRAQAQLTVSTASIALQPFEIEWRTNPALGPVRWLLARGRIGKPNAQGGTTYIGIVLDITARKQAEQAAIKLNETLEQRVAERTAALSESERLLHHILDGVPGMVGYWGADLINRFANKAYVEWFGLTPQQIKGRHIRTVLGEDLFERNWPYMQAALAGQAQRFERILPVAMQSGTFRHSEAHYLPDVVDGVVKGFLVMVFDISQVKQAELSAQAANHAKSEFLANISHEVRTPLNAMFGLAQVGARHAVGTPAARTFEQILDAAKHLLALVNDVLDFSKIEAGKLQLLQECVNLGEVLNHVVLLKAVRAQAKGLGLHIQESAHVPAFFLGDATRLSQILLNLLSNAIKYTHTGDVRLGISVDQQGLAISVVDTGVGIAQAEWQRAFQPFEQLHHPFQVKEGGTGLGLAITKRLVEMMNGRIWFDSKPGVGTTFHVSLPLTGTQSPDMRPLQQVWLMGLPETDGALLGQSLLDRGCSVVHTINLPPDDAIAGLLVIDERLLIKLPQMQLRQRLQQGHRLLVAAHANAFDLPGHLQNMLQDQVCVLSGPLSPLRLLNALHMAPKPIISSGRHRLADISVLAAEDNPVNRLVLGQMLEQEGAQVSFAFDGSQALEQVQAHEPGHFDIVLCDIQMPVMDGYQTAQALSTLAPTLPVIGLTAHAFESAKQQARLAGMVGYVTKPYMLDTLVEEIRRHARKRPGSDTKTAAVASQPDPLPTTPPPMQEDLTDWQAMQQYFREQPALLDKLIGMLTRTLSDIERDLDLAMSTHDLDALAKVAHNIKGTALNLHTPELTRLAIQTQEQARQLTTEAMETAQTLSHKLHHFIELAARHQQQGQSRLADEQPSPLRQPHQ
jgi:PAS domain S-box-containing protein